MEEMTPELDRVIDAATKPRRIRVSFDLDLPPEAEKCSDAQIQEWLRFELHENGSMQDSPLSECEVYPLAFSVEWEDK